MAPNYPSRPFMGICVLIALLEMLLFLKGKGTEKDLEKIHLRHSIVFLIAYFVVFFQRATDFTLGLIDQFTLNVEDLLWAHSPHVVSKACALSLIGFSAFIYGYYSYKHIGNRETKCYYGFRLKNELVLSAFLLLVLYVMLTGIGDFTKKGEEEENAGFLMVLQAIFLAIIVAYIYEYKHYAIVNKKRHFLLPLLLIAFYLAIYFLTANRGGGIKVCLMLLASYVYIKKEKANLKKVFICFILGALSMTVIGFIRTMETKNLNEAAALMATQETVSPLTVELSGSVNTVHVALDNYPYKQKYNYGTSFFQGFTVLVPGLSRLTHDIKGEASGEVLTRMYFGGSIPDWGWGLGSSAVADVYISFGMFGVLIVFFLFGKFIHYLEYGTFVSDKSPYFLVLSFCVYSQFISLCRGPFSILFLSWDYALIIVFICSVRHLKKQHD